MTATRTPEFVAVHTAKVEGIAEAKGMIEAIVGAAFERHIAGIRAHYTKAHEKAERIVARTAREHATALKRRAEAAERKCEAEPVGTPAAVRFAFMAHEFRIAEEAFRARIAAGEV